MNIIRLMGGMGNQMFQYAFGKLQMLNGITVSYDRSFYKPSALRSPYPRLFHLDKFHTQIAILPFRPKFPTIKEHKVGFDMSLAIRDNANFEGYWQYYQYIKPVLPTLRNEFILKEQYYTKEFIDLKKEITESSSIAVHIRRGDYLLHSGAFRNMPFNYYMRALSINPEGKTIYIFSDDLPWCRSKFKKDYFYRDIVFVDLNEFLSFELMRLCKHHIIANSTFSYWAAMLKDDPEQIVVCPKEWLMNKVQDDGNEIYFPKQWIKLPINAI